MQFVLLSASIYLSLSLLIICLSVSLSVSHSVSLSLYRHAHTHTHTLTHKVKLLVCIHLDLLLPWRIILLKRMAGKLAASALAAFGFCCLFMSMTNALDPQPWVKGHATFYGGPDGSGTMGGACGYGDLNQNGYGILTAATSNVMFNDGNGCGQCYILKCDVATDSQWCVAGTQVTITATNFCPPNYAEPSNAGGWCNPPLQHFDMAQPAYEKIGIYKGGIIPVLFQRVPCPVKGGIKMKINGRDYFQLILMTNVGGAGSFQSMYIKATKTQWVSMSRNWGANWQANGYLDGQALSFKFTTTDGITKQFDDAVPPSWRFGQTFMTASNF